MDIHASPRPRRTARTAVAALIAAAGCWGVGTVVSKQVVDDVPPLTLLPVQLAASCAFLLVVALVRREPLTWSPSVRRLAALGVLNPSIAYVLDAELSSRAGGDCPQELVRVEAAAQAVEVGLVRPQ
jgi:drug/metabolite transporter (DMT)-like permease